MNRISNALNELMLASREVYGDNILVDVQFNVVLGPQSRLDLTDVRIDDILGDEPNGNV